MKPGRWGCPLVIAAYEKGVTVLYEADLRWRESYPVSPLCSISFRASNVCMNGDILPLPLRLLLVVLAKFERSKFNLLCSYISILQNSQSDLPLRRPPSLLSEHPYSHSALVAAPTLPSPEPSP